MKLFKRLSSIGIATVMSAAFVCGSIPVLAADDVDYDTETTRYISYNCVTGEEKIIDMSKYLCEGMSVEADIAPISIIGEDNRGKVDITDIAPFRGIGYLTCKKPSNNGKITMATCSSFASNAVITAAHVVWDNTYNQTASNFNITFGKNGYLEPFGTVTAQPIEIIIPEMYKKNPLDNYDYAILIYNGTISNYRFGFTTSAKVGEYVTLTGYLSEKIVDGITVENAQWTASGPIKTVETDLITYEIDATNGQSVRQQHLLFMSKKNRK